MKLNRSLLALLAATMISGFAYAEDPAPAPKPEAPAAEKAGKPMKPKAVKLWGDWKLIEASLTAEQKDQIGKIHETTLAETNKLKDKETADITALLTDAQKEELAKAIEKDKADKKEKSGKAKEKTEKPKAE